MLSNSFSSPADGALILKLDVRTAPTTLSISLPTPDTVNSIKYDPTTSGVNDADDAFGVEIVARDPGGLLTNSQAQEVTPVSLVFVRFTATPTLKLSVLPMTPLIFIAAVTIKSIPPSAILNIDISYNNY
jgi:hypothetical protein